MDRTTRNLLLTIGAFVAVFAAWIAVRAANPKPAKAEFKVTENEIGHVLAGEKADVEFPVRNAGGKELKILGVQGSCGCLSPKFPSSIRPGGTGIIQTTFTASPEWHGHMKKELTVQTNDPTQPELKLHLGVDVDPLVELDPPSPVQLQVHRGQVIRQTVRITPREGIQLKAGPPEVNQPYLQAKLVPAGDGKSHLLNLAMGPCNESVDLVGKVTLLTTSPKLPRISVIAVALQLDGPVASPPEIMFSSIESGAAGGEVTRMQVFTRAQQEFEIRGAQVSIPGLATKVETDSAGRLYGVRLVRKGPLKPGRHTGKVEIRTNAPKYPVLSVPVDLTVR